MTKSRKRENLYIMLFQTDFHESDAVDEQITLFLDRLDDEDATKKAKGELKDRFGEIMKRIPEIDEKIGEKAQGWDLKRIAKSDLSVLRLGVFEILFDEEVPNNVAISEAVALAKKYGGDKSFKFINGILGNIARELPVEEDK